MPRCVRCGREDVDLAVVGNLCLGCFQRRGNRTCCICGRELEREEQYYEYWDESYFGVIGRASQIIHGRVCSDCINNLVRCSACGRFVSPHTEEIYFLRELGSGRILEEAVCQRCWNDRYRECFHCRGAINTETQSFSQDTTGQVLCSACQSLYAVCAECGRFISLERVNIHEEGVLLYYYCDDCVNRNEEYGNDDSSYEDNYEYEEEEVINRYSFKPRPIFHLFPTEETKKGRPLFLGVELEIDGGGEDNYYANLILKEGYPGFFYMKRDGSLQNGFEIVSHPATLAFHLIEAGWDRVLKKAIELGYTSHDNKRCGLHIHINRTFWGPDEEDHEIGELKLLIFFERFWAELVKFSRRTPSQIESYCARYFTEDLERAKRQNGNCRYFSLNFQNYYTIEVRMFRGTLKIETFFATLQFVHYLCYYLKNKTPQELQKLTWKSLIKGIPEWMVELKEYMKKRGLAS
jgi:hypothetical protein